jgi:AcrR family transcriptional regulator
MEKARKKRVSKAEWLAKALETLAVEGWQGVRVDRMASEFGISRAGFYWHFENRDDLMQSMLDYWAHEYTAVVTENVQLQEGDPKDRLNMTRTMILEYDLTKYDLAIRDWATHDKAAAKAVKSVDQMRFGFVGRLFREMGFRGKQLEMRTQLFVCYHSCEFGMFANHSKANREKLSRLQYDLLVTK